MFLDQRTARRVRAVSRAATALVDLGTEFGLNAAADGTANDMVFRGQASVSLLGADGRTTQSALLEGQQSVRVDAPAATYVACGDDGRILGTYLLKPNQPGLGGHVCNCGYVVAPNAQGQGLASAMCARSQRLALAMGFRAMQFNAVVETNTPAVALWRSLGFEILTTVPKSFRHPTEGDVGLHVMYRSL